MKKVSKPQHYFVYVDMVLKEAHQHLFIYLLMYCISIYFTQIWGRHGVLYTLY